MRCILVAFLFIGCAPKPKQPEVAPDSPPVKSMCEMGFGCDLVIDSTGVRYGRPM